MRKLVFLVMVAPLWYFVGVIEHMLYGWSQLHAKDWYAGPLADAFGLFLILAVVVATAAIVEMLMPKIDDV